MKSGIYKITNVINGKVYVGASINIIKRWNDHIDNARNMNREEKYKTLYLAFDKYGILNFNFQVLEFCDKNLLSTRESFWISELNSYKLGYNQTTGGDIGGFDRCGEKHPKCKLTKNDVIEIRKRYSNLERKKVVYKDYVDKIGFSGFSKVWKGETWRDVSMEVYTKNNIDFHRNNTGNSGESNGRSLLSYEQVKNILQRKENGECFSSVADDFDCVVSRKYIYNIWNRYTWKNV